MDRYIITNINPVTGCVSLSFDYQGNHRDWEVYVDTSNVDLITQTCDQEYSNFQAEIDNQPVLSKDVSDLIGNEKTSKEVAVSLRLSPLKPTMEVQ
jgi:hypothetical protein